MNIHEYQAKAVLREFGVPVSRGIAVLRAADAKTAAEELGGPVWVVKSQIHAGGRGKGKFKEPEAGAKGGVRLAKSVAEVETFVGEMLGRTLVTVQTGPAGKQVQRLYITDGVDIAKEFYVALLVLLIVGFVSVVFLPVYVLVAGVFVSLVQAHALREIRRRHGDLLDEPVDEGGRLRVCRAPTASWAGATA